MEPAPTHLLAAALAAALAIALVQWLRLWLRGALARRSLRARCDRAALGEARAEGLLRRLGYDVLGRQAAGSWVVEVDGRELVVGVRADYLVERGGRRLVAEVKTGRAAPHVESSATRRQLLEYRFAFDVDGVLLVDAEADVVREVVFPLPVAPASPSRAPLVAVCAFAFGLAAGALGAGALREAASRAADAVSTAARPR
jgi:hypothetical protein